MKQLYQLDKGYNRPSVTKPRGVKKSLKTLPRGVNKSPKSLPRGIGKAANCIKHCKTTADSVPEPVAHFV